MSTLANERPYIRSMGDEPLPGYRLISPLGMGGFGEVWKCIAPGGLHKAIKFVYEDQNTEETGCLSQEYEAFLRIKAIRHPFLLTLERVELQGNELIMVMELADTNLSQKFDEYRSQRLPGIPRRQLMSYMVDIAEALDVLSSEHGLQHLDVKPANLFLLGGHVKVGDYGLVSRFKASKDGEEIKLGRGLTPKYVAPEVLSERVDGRSDQYMLALVFQELLTGTFPYSGQTARQLLLQHMSAEPDLSALPPTDRPIIARALTKDPVGRFPSCLAFVKALLRTDPTSATVTASVSNNTPSAAFTTLSQHRQLPPIVTQTLSSKANIHNTQAKFGDSNSLSMTQRVLPNLTQRTNKSWLTGASDDLERVCPGFVFLEDIENSTRGKVVKAIDTQGRSVIVQILRLDGGISAEFSPIIDAIQQPHPNLHQEVISPHPRTVALIRPQSVMTLQQIIAKQSEPGAVPLRRNAILKYLEPVAQTIDGLNQRDGFAHMLLAPSQILIEPNQQGVTGYGAGELLRRSRADNDWTIGLNYVAPEVQRGQSSIRSDQYSLALIYLELLGAWSSSQRSGTRIDRSGATSRVDLSLLNDLEKQAIRRALSIHPQERFASCQDFIEAVRLKQTHTVALDELRLVESTSALMGNSSSQEPPPPLKYAQWIYGYVLNSIGEKQTIINNAPVPYVTQLSDGRLVCRFPVKLTAELAKLKLTAFKDQWGYTMTDWAADTVALRPAYQTPQNSQATPTMLQAPSRQVELIVELPKPTQASATEITVTGRFLGRDQSSKSIETIVTILEHFRRAVQNTDDRRMVPRIECEMALNVFPIDDELQVGSAIRGKCSNVSLSGFGCTLTEPIPTNHFFVSFASGERTAGWAILARRIRQETQSDGSIVLGGHFLYAGN